MNLTDSDILKFQKGTPFFLDDICIIYNATIGEIVDFGYEKFLTCLNILTMRKPATVNNNSKLKEILNNLSDFQYILMLVSSDREVNEFFREGFRFFCHEEIFLSLDPAQIVVGPLQEKHLLTEGKFYEFQKILRHMFFIDEEENDDKNLIFEDDNPAVKTLKMQMKKRKELLHKIKTKQAAKDGGNLNFSDLIGSITINNCGLNMENIWNITYYAFHDQLRRMGWRDQFNINNQAALAGAKIEKSQSKHWIRSIADSNKK